MSKNRFLLRFVDVVLILLFGFIVISDIDEDSQIILPTSSETQTVAGGSEVVLFIGITSEGRFIDERENILLSSERELTTYIQRHKDRFGEIAKVRIRANYDTEAKHAITVARICDEIGIKKALDVRIIRSR